MRICSFLPSATEILYALGLGDEVAGVTYECDYPPEARTKSVVVHTRLAPSKDSAEIDRQVSEFLARGESLYQVDLDALQRIEPDLIVTQDLCHVCAASPDDLGAALAALARPPRVLSLTPRTLADVWRDIETVGEATGRAAEAKRIVAEAEERVAAVVRAVAAAPVRPRVLCLEWLDPPFAAGHWVPEMVACAGGSDVLGRAGEPGYGVQWGQVLSSEPDVIVLMPCGYGLEQCVEESRATRFPAGWNDLPAVRAGRVFATDASSYFSRPGPRLATGVEILGRVIHPGRVRVALPPGAEARPVVRAVAAT